MLRLLPTLLLIQFCLIFVSNSVAAPIVSTHQNIEVSIDDDALEMTISTKDGSSFLVEYFDLSSPRRLVIDIRNQISQRNRLIRINSKMFSALRFGAHGDRTRVVFDVRAQDLPSYRVSQDGSRLHIALDSSQQASIMATPRAVSRSEGLEQPTVSIEPIETPQVVEASPTSTATALTVASPTVAPIVATSTPTSIPTELSTAAPPTPTLSSVASPSATISEPIVNATATPQESSDTVEIDTPAAKTTEITTPSIVPSSIASPTQSSPDPNAAPAVGAIIFEREGQLQSPIIRIKLNRRSEYKMSRLDDKFYKISIPAVRLERPGLGLPQFPPQDFEGFSLVSAKDDTRGVEIKVGVERNSRLTVVPTENDILVRIAK